MVKGKKKEREEEEKTSSVRLIMYLLLKYRVSPFYFQVLLHVNRQTHLSSGSIPRVLIKYQVCASIKANQVFALEIECEK